MKANRDWRILLGIVSIMLILWVSLANCAMVNQQLKQNRVDSLKIQPRARAALLAHYRNFTREKQVEFIFCAYGSFRRNHLVIERIELPPQRQFKGEIEHAKFNLCSPGFVALGHSHMIGGFGIMSPTDNELVRKRPEPAHILVWSPGDTVKFDAFAKPK